MEGGVEALFVPGRDLFEEIDTDSSGGIDTDELAAGLASRGYTVTRDEVEQLIDRMDINQDGYIAFDEFSSALVDWKKVSKVVYRASKGATCLYGCLHGAALLCSRVLGDCCHETWHSPPLSCDVL